MYERQTTNYRISKKIVICPNCGVENSISDPPKSNRKYKCGKCSSRLQESSIKVGNTSGMGKSAQIPPEIRGWNWGACFLGIIWGVAHNVWISIACLVPVLWIIMPFVLGAEGNKLAWQNKKWASVEQFKRSQRTWARWGLGVFGVNAVMFLFIVVLGTMS